MSSDRHVLLAMAMKTGQEMRFFEMVNICNASLAKQCFLGLGKHGLYFLQKNLNAILEGGEVYYAYVEKCVVDTNSATDICIVLNDNRPSVWESERLFIRSENRTLLVRHLHCNWQADFMWRFGRVAVFPKFSGAITRPGENTEPQVVPYGGWVWREYQGYRFFLREDFKDQPNAMQDNDTGEYVSSDGMQVIIHVHEPLTFEQLHLLHRDHIRWVSIEYKENLTSDVGPFYVIRNAIYNKKMNLSGDRAAWFGWELFIKTQQFVLVCILLRRQFIPPVANSSQDIAVMLRIPSEIVEEKKWTDDFIAAKCQLVADSLSADATGYSIYRDVVQSKLDTLSFDEEGYSWIAAHLKLTTMQRIHAKRFLRSILEIYYNDAPHAMGEDRRLMDDPDSLVYRFDDEDWVGLTPAEDPVMEIADMMRDPGPKKPTDSDWNGIPNDLEDSKVRNRWFARVARYLAWACDGGLIGCRFTMMDMVELRMTLTLDNAKKIGKILEFLLHLRPKDFTRPYYEISLVQTLREANFSHWIFNDRVMQTLIETDYIKKLFGRGNDLEYFTCMGHLLEGNCSTNLKAGICRQVIGAAKLSEGCKMVLVVPLVSLIKHEGVFLATYGTAALVNLSGGNEDIKNTLMGSGIASVLVGQLKKKDDDLMLYSLKLAVNLTKETHRRVIMGSYGAVPVLVDILTSCYSNILFKERILIQFCSVFGQFCNDTEPRETINEKYSMCVECLLYILDVAKIGQELAAKVMFALKQLCANSNDVKFRVGAHAISKLIKDINDIALDEKLRTGKLLEWVIHAVGLLTMLAQSVMNCESMKDRDLGPAVDNFIKQPWVLKSKNFAGSVEKMVELTEIVRRQTHREAF